MIVFGISKNKGGIDMKEKILFIDTETGGIDPQRHSLLTIGLAVWNYSEGVIDAIELKIKRDCYHVTPVAMKINNINLGDLDTFPEEVMVKIKEFLGRHFTKGKIRVGGHNVGFDVVFLKKFFLEMGEDWDKIFDYHLIDTSVIATYLSDVGKLKCGSGLGALIDNFKIKVNDRHTAKEDAIAAATVYSIFVRM